MALVVDASVALAWALPDETSAYADAVLNTVEQHGTLVPDLWAREIASGIAIAYIRNRMTSSDELVFLNLLLRLDIDVEAQTSAASAIRDGIAAASRYGLTAYDAVYVDLAAREGLTLATLDKAMAKAAKQAGVTVFK